MFQYLFPSGARVQIASLSLNLFAIIPRETGIEALVHNRYIFSSCAAHFLSISYSTEKMPETTVRVAVIGAGASGIAQLKHLLNAFSKIEGLCELQVTLLESKDRVGGVWWVSHRRVANNNRLTDYQPKRYKSSFTGDSGEHAHFFAPIGNDPSAMYDGLRTNLPHVSRTMRQVLINRT
jgi:hypothetical protein